MTRHDDLSNIGPNEADEALDPSIGSGTPDTAPDITPTVTIADRLRAAWANEPVRIVTLLVAVIVFAAAKVGIVLDQEDVGSALLLIIPILLGGEAARSKVRPDQPVR